MSRVETRRNEIFELSAESAPAYLLQRKVTRPGEQVLCRELGGGVSNTVILVEKGSERFILKQALPQLRVEAEWLADRSRAVRERNALEDAARLLPKGWTPRVLWSDDGNFLYAMEAAQEPHEFWKNHLLAGRIDPLLARRTGVALGLTIRGTWRSERFEQIYRDRTAFDQLRTDPYYRVIAERNPDVAAAVAEWLPETAAWRVALVHGDWSPKNMIVTPGGMVFIDYECAHFGDPSFDAAFCLNHFLLKSFYRPALAESYLHLGRVFFTWTLAVLPPEALRDFERMTARHLGFLLLARVDGKSPAEYITAERTRNEIRETAKIMIHERTATVEGCLGIAARGVGRCG
jgi:5-methylthioribose kinase